ncbi:MAG TPA: ferrous iron transport protein B [Spirochaetia bacterium]|nr:ferrous iron transport protein B [Spirochaetia bacterium]
MSQELAAKTQATERDAVLALAGNANVGKSVIFNALTGMNQIIGNWPGKTVERAEGYFVHHGRRMKVIDLPGTYSLTAYTEEEQVTLDYLIGGNADAVVNVLDATVLERNLYFTLQLLEMGLPVVIALNLMDLAERSGIHIDEAKLEAGLGVPVIKTSGVTGKGIDRLVESTLNRPAAAARNVVTYGREVEEAIEFTLEELRSAGIVDPTTHEANRFLAVKLLEGEEGIEQLFSEGAALDGVRQRVRERAATIERIHGESFATVMASERYAVCARLVEEAVRKPKGHRIDRQDRLDAMVLHRFSGWVIFVVVMFGLFGLVYFGGDRISVVLDGLTGDLKTLFFSLHLPPWLRDFLWSGVFQGVFAGISVALPYIVPFYIILSLLENSGYLARIAFLTDSLMHRLGLHGKAFIPIVLGLGCNVPAVLGTKIMEEKRTRFIAAILATIVPCSARTVVILGLVGVFMGFLPAISLYLINILVIFVVGKILNRMLPGTNPGLIMEMPRLRVPPFKVTFRQTWFRLKDFVTFAFPVIVGGSFVLYLLQLLGLMQPISDFLRPVTEGVFGLPAVSVIVLLFGILRKELALIMLTTFMHTTLLNTVMTPQQMYVFALIVMLYVPCVSTIAVLRREFGRRRAALISFGEVAGALVLGAAVNWGWNLVRLFA